MSVGSETQAQPVTAGVCPLKAEEVGEVLEAELEAAEGSCSFFPTDGALPNAAYNPQTTMALLEETRAEYGYDDAVAGVGDEAYEARLADGTWLLVRAGTLIFEIRVDMDPADDELAAARRLAEQILTSG